MTWRKSIPLLGVIGLLTLLVTALSGQATGAGELHAVQIPTHELGEARELGLQPTIALDYGSYHWLMLDASDLARLAASGLVHTEDADAGSLQITNFRFDPIRDGEPALSEAMRSQTSGPAFRLVQFYGPVNDEWIAELEAAGLDVLQYYPHYAFLVWGTADQVAAAESNVPIRWSGPVHPGYKMNSDLLNRAGTVKNVDIFFYNDGNIRATLDAISALGANVLQSFPAQPDQAFYTAIVELNADRFDALAGIDTVLWFGYASPEPILDDEMSAQIVAGNYIAGVPFTGYNAHLADLGVNGAGVTWAVVDTGVDYDHPDLNSRIVGGYNFPGACNTGNPGEDCSNGGHGTHVAGIIGGDATAGFSDPSGFLYGLGMAPEYGIFAMNSLSAPSWPPSGGWQEHSKRAVLGGAIGGNNSWTTGEGTNHGYQASERTHDIMVLDGNFDTTDVAEPFIEVFSAGNSGASGLTAPKEGKNLIVTASSRNYRAGNIDTISSFSSRGPAVDGRWVPTIAAPGEQIASTRNNTGGVCATPIGGTNNLYAFCSGTSMAAPHTAGAIVLVTEWWRGFNSGADPSSAMAKALLVNGAVDMAPADIPNIHEGWGRINVTNIISPTGEALYYEEPVVFGNSGEQWIASVSVLDPSQPAKITLAWADAPGAVGANPALVNNLNLTVVNGGTTYQGNVFSGGWSTSGGTADSINNLENVYIQSPAAGSLQITVDAVNIAGDAILYNGDPTDQSFALVCQNCVSQPDFTLEATPVSQTACVGDSVLYDVAVGSIIGYSDPVTLSTQGEPAGATTSFSPNPVTPPNNSTLTVTDDGTSAAGLYDIHIIGVAPTSTHTTTVQLLMYADVPTGAVMPIAPPDGAIGVTLAPTLTWTANTDASAYLVEVATDSGFSNIVFSETTAATSYALPTALPADTLVYWRVTPQNNCGAGSPSAVFTFRTVDVAPILLVDDDDNQPDVRSSYTFVLDILDVAYDVWDTNNGDDEPTAADLGPYEVVIWFTGAGSDEFTGPGAAGETALADFLDHNKCLMLSSQDYYDRRGLTSLMSGYLGVTSVASDATHTLVTGDGVFAGLGPYTLSYSFANLSDAITPAPGAEIAFAGNNGTAAISRVDGYRASYFAFPYEAIPTTSARLNTLAAFQNWCAELHAPEVSGDQTGYGAAGAAVIYDFTITNAGGVPDAFALTVESDWQVTQSIYGTGVLNPGESVELSLTVMIPDGLSDGESNVALLTVRSLDASSLAATATATTIVDNSVQEEHFLFLPLVLRQE